MKNLILKRTANKNFKIATNLRECSSPQIRTSKMSRGQDQLVTGEENIIQVQYFFFFYFHHFTFALAD